ncbi:MAG: hypothetical protein ACWA5A_04495 [Marinibacterium sp.]
MPRTDTTRSGMAAVKRPLPAGTPEPDRAVSRSAPSAAEVERALEAIIASGVLGKSTRRADLLRYLVDMEMSGRGDAIKAFGIGVDILGRDASFDPNSDSIVRSEVGRLRTALQLFYAGYAGRDLPVITIPTGTYRPRIAPPQANPDSAGDPGKSPRPWYLVPAFLAGMAVCLLAVASLIRSHPPAEAGPDSPLGDLPYDVARIAVAPLKAMGGHKDVDILAYGIAAELPIDLSAYPWISVVSPLDGYGDAVDAPVDYVLNGSVFWEDDTLIGTAQLIALPDQHVIWSGSNTARADVPSIEAAIIEFSNEIAQALGPLHGIAPELVKAQNARSSEAGLDAFLCFLGMYQYLNAPTDAAHLHLRTCLSDAVKAYPQYGDGWAALAMIYMDEARFGHNPRGGDPWADAGHAVEQALKYEPLRMPVLIAALIYSIEAPERDLDAFQSHARRLVDLFPRHPPTLVAVGARLAQFAGQWDRGLSMVAEAIELHRAPPSAYYITPAMKAVLDEDDDTALLRAVAPLTGPTFRTELILNYIAAARNGMPDRMQHFRKLMAKRGMYSEGEILAQVRYRRYSDELETALVRQLQAAFALEAEN